MLGTRRTALLAALLLLAAGLVVNAILGPLFTGVLDYRLSETMTSQRAGVDAVGMFVVAPLALFAARLVDRDLIGGPPLAFVPGTFAVYWAPHMVIGPDYAALPGNNEHFFLLHASLFLLGVAVLLLGWEHVDRLQLLPDDRPADRRRAWLLVLLALLVVARWLPVLLPDVLGGIAEDPVHEPNPTGRLLSVFVDLAVVVPATVAAAFGLWTRAVWGRAAAYMMIGFYAMAPLTFAAMAAAMVVTAAPMASVSAAFGLSVVALVAIIGAVFLYSPLGVDRPAVVPRAWVREYREER